LNILPILFFAEPDDENLPIVEGQSKVGHLLEGSPDGTYLISKLGSKSDPIPYIIYVRRTSSRSNELKTKKIKVLSVPVGTDFKYKIDGNAQLYSTLRELIDNWGRDRFLHPFSRESLTQLPFYIGEGSHKEAEKLIRSGQFEYVLRQNVRKELRLAIMSKSANK
jgi:hypothetical protein